LEKTKNEKYINNKNKVMVENMVNKKAQGAKAPNESIAQGAIEYLLIIGAAILVVAVVIVAITGVL
jgi:hypothetical protein